ncbi:MAG TPA: Rv3654c family TadE-like protein [Pseudonocardiaceae bacterium]|jgi:secretion/DNA translocation related TadE-like protein|nr:Rv3654c family TadE-like protein [Pseudonocardiaceae bacterium]
MSGHHPRRRRPGGDTGLATLWAVGGIAVLCLFAAAVITYGAVVQTRHRATAAADLAALAGAGYAPYGQTAACDRARWVASGMRVRVTGCRLDHWDVLVEVSASLPGELTRFGTVHEHSRAGPADP